MMWGITPLEFRWVHQRSETHEISQMTVIHSSQCRMTKLDPRCFGPLCAKIVQLWNMGDFISLEKHLEARGTSAQDTWLLTLWPLESSKTSIASFCELSWTGIASGSRFAELSEDLNVWLWINRNKNVWSTREAMKENLVFVWLGDLSNRRSGLGTRLTKVAKVLNLA